MSIKVNKKAPNFILFDQNNKKIELNKLKFNLVLFFYPKDNTPGCTKEAISFSKYKQKINSLGYHIFGISKDSIKKHQGFIQKQDLSIDLLSDENEKTCEDYGVWVEKSMYGKKYLGIERTTFLINKKKIITKIWNKVKVTNHIEEVIQYIEEN
ncbi:MAG: thioredoxin-dependent thiol peroxidase [Alphaproteobacteria bacterium TMED62]|nr:MAG: thioredoxin-dependent thiol peroxidase [Alphaproteobacteria bacterium TMED62]